MAKVSSRVAVQPCWFDLMSDDIPNAKIFYKALFGWDFVDGPPEVGGYVMCFKDGAVVAGIGPRFPDSPSPSCWSVYVASDGLEADHARATQLGGKILMGPMDIMDQGRMSMLMDPTGAVFGLWQAGQHKGSELEGEHGAMAWCEVNTRQGESACSFYAKLLNLAPSPWRVRSTGCSARKTRTAAWAKGGAG